MAKIHVTATVNGNETEFLCKAHHTLLSVLRDTLGLTGTKEGCGSGDCGACSIKMNGRVVCSCLVLAPEANGSEIETIEGLAGDQEMHSIQRVFIEEAALQCGICTPGLLIAAKDLLDRNPDPSETEIRFWIAGNLCRCTGYDKIVRAIKKAAQTSWKNS